LLHKLEARALFVRIRWAHQPLGAAKLDDAGLFGSRRQGRVMCRGSNEAGRDRIH
jgi:hypothetical protein